MHGSLLDLDVAAGFDVQYRPGGEGERDVSVENQPEMLVVLCRGLQEAFELGIERRCPFGLVADRAFVEVRD
ncbi:hypothetical protein D3C81_2016060 [compost metagenome]